MTDHPHAARYRELIDEFNAGNFERLGEALAPDVRWWQIGVDEPIVGAEALAATMAEQSGQWEVKFELHDVVSNDEHLIALGTATANRDGDTLVYRTAEIHHVDSEGRVTERWAFSDDTQAIIEFFS